MKVNEGYKFRKWRSRSKKVSDHEVSNDPPKAKQPKTTDNVRKQHIEDLEEDIKDLTDRLSFKQKRQNQAEMSRNYKVCDQLMEEISDLKKKKREKEIELKLWKRKVQQSLWYRRKGKSTSSETEDDTKGRQSISVTPQSPTSPSVFSSFTLSPRSSVSSPHHVPVISTPLSSRENSF